MEAMREVYWNIPAAWKFFFLSVATIGTSLFFLGLWTRVRIWSQGRDEENELKGLGTRELIQLSILKFFSRDCILAKRLFARSWFRGVMLLFIVWSFLALFSGTVLVTLEHYFNLRFFLVGRVYLIFSLILDIAGGFLLVGIAAALIRRYTAALDRRISTPEDVAFLGLLFVVVLLGYSVEGFRLAILNPPGFDWSPVGGLFARAAAALLPQESLPLAHRTAWLIHGIAAQVFIAYIPFSKMFHLVAAQISTTVSSSRYGGIVYED
jgi:nitrate reductase gamma subunit